MGAQEGQGRVCDPDYPDRCSQRILRGQEAPYTGELLTDELAIALGMKASGCDRRVTIEKERGGALINVERELRRQQLSIVEGACKDQAAIFAKRLEEATDPPPFWEKPWFVASVTATVTVAATVGVWWLGVKTIEAVAK